MKDQLRNDPRAPDYFIVGLVSLTVLSRAFTSGPVYFADGPDHLGVIRDHTYLLQPPGYWLFNRISGCFRDPESAILIMNWAESAFGVLFFYRLSLELFETRTARLGAILYSVIFFAWFSGNIHSTYASQLLFPVLTFYLLLSHKKTGSIWALAAASFSFAVGAGLRPSDGAFLLPLFCYQLWRSARKRHAIIFTLITAGLCLIWLIPTLHNPISLWQQLARDTEHSSAFRVGFASGAVANLLRFALPFLTAFWLLVPLLVRGFRKCHTELRTYCILWAAPGVVFFLFVYFADAPYMDFFVGAVLLFAMSCADGLSSKSSQALLLACAVWNAAFYLCFTPLGAMNTASPIHKAVTAYEIYAGKYTRWAVQHKWEPRLSDVMNASD